MSSGLLASLGLLLALASPPSPGASEASASVTVASAEGLHTVKFDTLQGTVTVDLPDDMQGGDTISGAVIVDPKGQSPAEQATNQDSLSGYVVEVDNQKTAASEGGGTWLVPAVAGAAVGLVPVILRDPAGHEVGRAQIPVRPQGPGSAKGSAAGAGRPVLSHVGGDGYAMPGTGQSGHPVEIRGPFDGNFASTQVRIGGSPARVLAESPRKAVFESPREVTGPADLQLTKGGRTAQCTYRSFGVRLSAAKTSLHSGERTPMTVTLEGAQGLDGKVEVAIVNHTPGVVRVEGGDRQTLSFSPSGKAPGPLTLVRQLTGIVPGGFSVSATAQPLQPAAQSCRTVATADVPVRPSPPSRPARPVPTRSVPPVPADAASRNPRIPDTPDDPDQLRGAALAVHTGSQWRLLAGGRGILVYRDNPPLTGRLDLPGGSVSTQLPLEDQRSATWRRWSRYFTFLDADVRLGGSEGATWTDEENADGYLGVAPAGPQVPQRLVFHANGLKLQPGSEVDLVLQRRTGTGAPYSRSWPWADVPDTSGSVMLAANTRLVAVEVIVVTEPQQAGQSILADRAHAELWFDGRTAGRRPQYTSNEGMATLVLDRDPRPNWSPEAFDDPGQGRDPSIMPQEVDAVWAYCGVHYDLNIQFRLVGYQEISSDVVPHCAQAASQVSDAEACVGRWAQWVHQSTGDPRPWVPVIFVRQYPAQGVAQTWDGGVLVGQEALSAYGPNVIAHELGHFLGGRIGIFVDGSNGGTNLMHQWHGPSREITLTREQCQAAWDNAAQWPAR